MPLDRRHRGLFFILLAALLWASGAVVGKGLFAAGVTPSALVQARCTIGAVALGLFLALFGRRHLAIAKEIVEAHGSDIVVEASAEAGTTFGFRLPAA